MILYLRGLLAWYKWRWRTANGLEKTAGRVGIVWVALFALICLGVWV